MRLQFDNRVSWMDIVAILGMGLTALGVVFGVQSDVEMNTARIAEIDKRLEAETRRINKTIDDQNVLILREFNGIEQEIREIRKESAEGRLRIEEKLDRLIERKLDQSP